jgi:Tfp pilus assembly protein PilX
MTTPTRRGLARGSALVLVVILLLVMTVVSVAVVRLASQARITSAAQSSHDALVECANAAQAQLWAAIGVNGKSYYQQPSSTMTVTSLRLPDGKELLAPAHIDGPASSSPALGIRSVAAGSPAGTTGDGDSTNTFTGGRSGVGAGATWVTARCKDASGRAHEIEFAFKFSL